MHFPRSYIGLLKPLKVWHSVENACINVLWQLSFRYKKQKLHNSNLDKSSVYSWQKISFKQVFFFLILPHQYSWIRSLMQWHQLWFQVSKCHMFFFFVPNHVQKNWMTSCSTEVRCAHKQTFNESKSLDNDFKRFPSILSHLKWEKIKKL